MENDATEVPTMTVNVLTTARDELDRLTRNLEGIWGFIGGLIDSVPQERWS